MSILLQYGNLGTFRRCDRLPCRVVSVLFKHKPDEDDERKTYSTPDGSADHATQVMTCIAYLWALIDIRSVGNCNKSDLVSQYS